MIGITHFSSAIPRHRIPVSKLIVQEGLDHADAADAAKLGIDEICSEDRRTSIELAIDASSQLLLDGEIAPEQLDLIILCQPRAPDSFMSSEALRLQEEIGAKNAIAMAVADLGCVSSSAALLMAQRFAASGSKKILISTTSRPFGTKRFRKGVTIIGDGASSVLLSAGEGSMILDTVMETNGRYWDLYRVDYRGRQPDDWVEASASMLKYSFELATESRARFTSLLNRLRTAFPQFEHLYHHAIMQNISIGGFKFYESALDLEFSPVCRSNLARFGHVGAADIFLNLREGIVSGRFKKGERVLILNNSPVAAWAATLVQL